MIWLFVFLSLLHPLSLLLPTSWLPSPPSLISLISTSIYIWSTCVRVLFLCDTVMCPTPWTWSWLLPSHVSMFPSMYRFNLFFSFLFFTSLFLSVCLFVCLIWLCRIRECVQYFNDLMVDFMMTISVWPWMKALAVPSRSNCAFYEILLLFFLHHGPRVGLLLIGSSSSKVS